MQGRPEKNGDCSLLYLLAQGFSGPEGHCIAGTNGDRLAGLRVFPGPGTPVPGLESAKPHQRQMIATAHGPDNLLQHALQNLPGLLPAEIGPAGNSTDKLCFTHK